jgi:hypothetical protein
MRKLTAVDTAWLGAITLIGAACTGVIGSPDENAGGGGGGVTVSGNGTSAGSALGPSQDSGSSGTPDSGSSSTISSPTLNMLFGPSTGAPTAAGAMVLRHLTQFEYLNTLTALFGSAAVTSAQVSTSNVPAEPPVPNTSSGFPLPGLIDSTTATAYQAAAEAMAKAILPNISGLLTCTAATGGAAGTAAQTCATTFITTFGQQAYRRPLSTAEVSVLIGLYQTGVSTLGLTFNGAIDLLVEEMLQSPGFLYHWEIGPTPTVTDPPGSNPTAPGVEVQLDGYAMANRLSYFLWGTMPDATLFAAAANQQLSTAAQVATQAARMLQDPKASPAVANFFEQWLGMYQLAAQPKDQTVYPNWGPALAAAMDSEFRTFVTSVIFNRTGQLSELLANSTTYINQDLATLYGASGITGTTLQSTTLNPAQRSGLLTTAAWLTLNGDPASSNPVYRGHSIYTQMLCGTIPPPPANVPPPAPASAGGTTRDRFVEHDTQPCATGCHSRMDPFGYAFENYDGIGQ